MFMVNWMVAGMKVVDWCRSMDAQTLLYCATKYGVVHRWFHFSPATMSPPRVFEIPTLAVPPVPAIRYTPQPERGWMANLKPNSASLFQFQLTP